MRHKELFAFMHERHKIYLLKQAGAPKPWTSDPILQNYRFTCAYRELDKVTVWIRENWREPHRCDPYLWFAMAVARYINWPATLEQIGYPVPFNARKVCKTLNAIAEKKTTRVMERLHKRTPYKIERTKTSYKPQVFGGAYFLNSIGPKIESIVNDRLNVLWQAREKITALLEQAGTLERVYEVLKAQFGFGSFMAAQVVADMKNTPQFDEELMTDWWTWAASGPGSRRGMWYVLGGYVIRDSFREEDWREHLAELHELINPLVAKAGMPPLHAQDLQGWLCEFSKYEKTRLGEGRPKTKYPGGK